ncbi:Aldehyde dehydrogenase [Klebsiella pneumoniae]|nr:Aldehyde dehydrogenase [Klebsiella pneumoniae]
MGPLANRQQYDKVLRLIQTARDEGDTIVCGGEALPGEGYFLQPTAVKVRSEESTLMRRGDLRPGMQLYRLSQRRRGAGTN